MLGSAGSGVGGGRPSARAAGAPRRRPSDLCAPASALAMLLDDAEAELRVALVTLHLPLSEVPRAVTRETLEAVLRVVDSDLRTRFGIPAPVIGVCGLSTSLADYEKAVIAHQADLLR